MVLTVDSKLPDLVLVNSMDRKGVYCQYRQCVFWDQKEVTALLLHYARFTTLLLRNPERRHTHASTDTHTRDTNLLPSPPELVEQC
jgi:hypothetical protein